MQKFGRRALNISTRWRPGFSIFEAALAEIGGSLLFIMALLVCSDIVARHLGKPLYGTVGASELLMACIIFLGLANAQKTGAFIRVEVLVSHASPFMKWLSKGADYVLSCAFFIFFSWRAAVAAHKSVAIREITYGILALPIYPAKIVLAAGCIIVLVEIADASYRHFGRRKI